MKNKGGGFISPLRGKKEDDIREKTLIEALQSPLFKAYRARQPFNENHLRPCPLLDNPEALREMVKESGAHSTDLQNPEDVDTLTAKCDAAAENWADIADDLWACDGHCEACKTRAVS